MTPDRCPCWVPWNHSDPTCPVVREQARTAAIAEARINANIAAGYAMAMRLSRSVREALGPSVAWTEDAAIRLLASVDEADEPVEEAS
jgi:hypothetical protein